MGPLVPILAGGAIVGYALMTEGQPAAVPPGAPIYPPNTGSTLADAATMATVDAQGHYFNAAGQQTSGLNGQTKGQLRQQAAAFVTAKQSGWVVASNPNPADPELQAKEDVIAAAAEQQFQNMSDVEKQRAADTLNDQLKLNPPLNGHETWEEIAGAVGAAAGAAAGTAICGPVCGYLGSLAGAYLGAKLEDLLAKHLDDVKSWAKSKAGWVEGKVDDAYDYVAGHLPF